MRSAAELCDLYEEWKRLTEKEGGAILSANWGEVSKCQRAKEQLQSRIVKLTESVNADHPAPAQQEELNSRIRHRINELIVLETENHTILGRCMATLQKERDELEGTSNRLKRVHQSYVPTRQPIWNQYS